jgi:hypothetical protein
MYILSIFVLLGLVVAPTRAGTDSDAELTKKLAVIFAECQSIKSGMTRAELFKLFKEDTGGVLPSSLFWLHCCCQFSVALKTRPSGRLV